MTEIAKSEAREARERASRIRIGMVSYLTTLADIRAAWEARDWIALGYATWDDYLAGEFSEHRLRVPAEHRDKAIAELRMAGMSNRAIAGSINVPQSTVGDVSRRLTGSGQIEQPDRVVSRDGSERPATRPKPEEVVPASEGWSGSTSSSSQPAPPPVEADAQLDAPEREAGAREDLTGVAPVESGDGTGVPAPVPPAAVEHPADSTAGTAAPAAAVPPTSPPAAQAGGEVNPRRAAITDAASTAGWELNKSVERIARLIDDDRYARNAEQVAQRLRGHLSNAIQTLSEVSDRLPKSHMEVTP